MWISPSAADLGQHLPSAVSQQCPDVPCVLQCGGRYPLTVHECVHLCVCVGGGGGAAVMKHEACDAQILTCSRPGSQTLAQVKVRKKNKRERNEGKETDSDHIPARGCKISWE